MDLASVWRQVRAREECGDCPLRRSGFPPLIVEVSEPSAVRVMAITEGPNRFSDVATITSVTNHPTYTFLYTLFKGEFKPSSPAANVYWTHVRKCFLDGNKKTGKSALAKCRDIYLESEIRALQPRLIVAVGGEALKFLARYEKRLKGKLIPVFLKQRTGIFTGVRINGVVCDIAIVPHPSGLNRFWNNVPEGTLEILEKIGKFSVELGENH